MPKQLNNGKVTAALQRAFGFKGRYIPMLDEVIVPVYQIADPAPAEPAKFCAGQNSTVSPISDPAEDVPQVGLLNPKGSGVLCIVSIASLTLLIDDSVPTPQQFAGVLAIQTKISEPNSLGFGGAAEGNSFFRDRRLRDINPSCVVQAINGAGASGAPLLGSSFISFPGTPTVEIRSQAIELRAPLFVLPPATLILFEVNRAATAYPTDQPLGFSGTFQWQEVPLQYSNPLGGLPT